MPKLDNNTVNVDEGGESIDTTEIIYKQYLVIKDRLDEQEKQLDKIRDILIFTVLAMCGSITILYALIL